MPVVVAKAGEALAFLRGVATKMVHNFEFWHILKGGGHGCLKMFTIVFTAASPGFLEEKNHA